MATRKTATTPTTATRRTTKAVTDQRPIPVLKASTVSDAAFPKATRNRAVDPVVVSVVEACMAGKPQAIDGIADKKQGDSLGMALRHYANKTYEHSLQCVYVDTEHRLYVRDSGETVKRGPRQSKKTTTKK